MRQKRQQPVETRFELNIASIKPLTIRQNKIFQSFSRSEKNVCLYGYAGTGKTFLALFFALEALFKRETCKRIIILRSAVQTRDQGFMPGKLAEKMADYENPYRDIVADLTGRPDAYDLLKQKGLIEFRSTSFLRGSSIADTFIVVDEAQSMNWHELNTVITRVAENSRIVFCGDFRQDDLIKNRYDRSGFKKLVDILETLPTFFDLHELKEDDIVRSKMVKEFIIAAENYEE